MRDIFLDDFLFLLKSFLDKSYRDGIDKILSWEYKDEQISGFFKDGNKVFKFEFNQSEISYQPIKKQKAQPIEEFNQDASNKHKTCRKATAFSCGFSCISNEKTCRIGARKGFDSDSAKKIISIAKQKQAKKDPAQIGAAKPFGQKNPDAVSHGAAQVDIPRPIFDRVRQNYRKNFPRSAQEAKIKAQDIQVGDIDDKYNGIIFATGGFSGDSKGGERLEKAIKKARIKDQYVVPISNKNFDIEEGQSLTSPEGARAALARVTSNVIQKGKNDTAIDIAANAYAYAQKYPSKQIILLGHSAGGIASHEAAEILENHLNTKVKVIALGSPHFGITEPTKQSITIASKQDWVVRRTPVMNAKWVDSVPGHGIEDYFGDKNSLREIKQFLKPEIRKDANLNPRSRLAMQLKFMLEKAYTDGIDRILEIDVNHIGYISGTFRDGRKLVDFEIKGTNVEYQSSEFRSDSYVEGLNEVRLDRKYRSKKPNCEAGISCGEACISRNKSCKFDLTKVASPQQIKAFKTSAIKATNQQKIVQADKYDTMTIRELKREASLRGVYRYSELNSTQLRDNLRTLDKPENEQRAIAKTFEQNQRTTTTLRKFGITGRGKARRIGNTERKVNPESSLASSVRRYNRIQRIMKLSEIDPGLATAAVTAVLAGVTIQQYNRMRDNYRLGLVQSGIAAEERASKMKAEYTPRGNITFTVGGFKNEGSTAEKLKAELESYADKLNAEDDDKWFRDSHMIIPFETEEFQIGKIKQKKYKSDGTYNPLYLAELSSKGFNAYLRNFKRGRNDDAVELAAKIYAYANYRDPKPGANFGKYMNENKSINLLAHSTGGNTVHEAIDILMRMNSPRARSGREVAKRINVVTLGTTDFGFTEKNEVRERNITSSQDPFSFLPQRNEKWVSSVRGHEVEDYMRNDLVKDQLLQAFGRFDRTAYQYERERNKD